MKGSFVALITPFHENGELDTYSLRKLVRMHLTEKTNGIVCLGTTGEKPTISHDEKKRIFEIVLDEVGGKIPVIIGTGTNDTQDSVRQTRLAKEMGADGALVVVPYYNKPTEKGCLLHFQEIAKVQFPLIFYHHPGRTGVFLSKEGIKKIMALSEVIALKEASGNVEFAKQIILEIEKPVLCGDDENLFSFLEFGAAGSISVMANLFPQLWSEIHQLYSSGEIQRSKDLFDLLRPLLQVIYLESNPIGIKYAMHLKSLCEPVLRLPMTTASEELQEKIDQAYLSLSDPVRNC